MDDGREATDELVLDHVTVVRRGRPRTWWAVLAALGLAAGALVVTSRAGDGTTRPGLPVSLGAAAGGGAEMAADMMRAPVTYVAGPDLPLLGGEAPAYRLRGTVDEARVRALADALGLSGEITHDGPTWTVTGEAGTLGVFEGGGAQWWYSATVEGDLRGGGGSVGSSGTGVACPEPAAGEPGDEPVTECAVTTVIPECVGGPAVDCATPPPDVGWDCPPGAMCPDQIDEPPVPTTIVPPADLPSEEEARATALDLLASTGLDVEGADVTLDGPYDAWFVTVEPRLDGIPTGLFASVSVGPNGVITSAGGYLASPEHLGDYPVLDTRAAIDRANAQPAFDPTYRGGVGVEVPLGTLDEGVAAEPEPGVSVEGPVTTVVECTVAADGTESCMPPELTCEEAMAATDDPLGAPEPAPCVDPIPLPVPDVEPIAVVLTSAVPSLVLLGAVDGSSDLYLVPGYRFEASDGGQIDLPAVADEALTTPPTTNSSAVPPSEPPVTDTAVPPPSTPTTSVPPTDPQPLPEGALPEVGVGYYVDVDTECPGFLLGGDLWLPEKGDLSGWSSPHEGGTFTLDDPDHGTFVGDAQGAKTAWFARVGDATDIDPMCVPTPRP